MASELGREPIPSAGYAESLLREGGLPRLLAALRRELAEGDATQLPNWLDLVLCARALPAGGTAAQVLQSLGHGRSEQRCPYVFKNGDIAWNCRTCQVDSTCVQCMDCFRDAQHDGHDVYFHRTARGGCCDCGDEEAWSPAGFCSRHTGLGAAYGQRGGCAALPEQLSETLPLVLDSVLQLLRLTLALTVASFHADHLPADAPSADADWRLPWDDVEPSAAGVPTVATDGVPVAEGSEGRAHMVMVLVHNDDVHTFDEVTSALMAISATREWAYELTHLIDRTGESVVAILPRAEALRKAAVLRERGLLVSTTDRAQRAREARAEAAVLWLCRVCELSDSTTAALAAALAAASIGDARAARLISLGCGPLPRALHRLSLRLIGQPEARLPFARAFHAAYPRLASRYVRGAGTAEDTVITTTLQQPLQQQQQPHYNNHHHCYCYCLCYYHHHHHRYYYCYKLQEHENEEE
ncbi:putative zinc finger in N-recognin-domain-containing protein [Pavlovales sp. CCMP2436]|nr:putative zinc finger in N-recognin-domain-containing protein [Pavlovales sp. CCMP2436]